MRVHVGVLLGLGAVVGLPALAGQLVALATAAPLFTPPTSPSPVQGRVDLRPPQPADSPRWAKHVPVDCQSGALVLSESDLVVPSRGFPWAWVRTYDSRAAHAGVFGTGWDLSFERTVVVLPSGDASVMDGAGREDVFPSDGAGGWTSPAGIFSTLVQNPDSTFTLTTPGGTRYQHDASGYLVSVSDKAQNTCTIQRNAAHEITKILDTQDRAYLVTFSTVVGLRVITKVQDFLGREIVYTYDSTTGDLLTVRSPVVTGDPNSNDYSAGKVTRYSWSSGASDARLNHNLLSITDPGYLGATPAQDTPWLAVDYYGVNSPTHLRFDRVHKVRWGHNQGGPPASPNTVVGGNVLFFYQDTLTGDTEAPATAVFRAIERDPNGNDRVRYFDADRQVVKLIERTNRNIRPGEGDHVTTWTHTAEGLVASVVYPRGNGASMVYDAGNPQRRAQGNLLEVRRQANGIAGGGVDLVTRFTWEPVFQGLRTRTDARAFPLGTVPLDVAGHLDLTDAGVARFTVTSLYDYQEGTGFQAAQGVPTSERIPDGLGDQNAATDFNEGNVVRTVAPAIQTVGPNLGDVASGLFRWNTFGQLVEEMTPDGDFTRFEFFASSGTAEDPSDFEGYLKARIVDPNGLALRTELDVDQAGNIVAERDAKGQQTDLVVNALNQVVRRVSRPVTPGGVRYQTDYLYSANDDLVEVRTANLDEAGVAYPHATLVDRFEFNILHAKVAEVLDKTRNDGTAAGTVRTEFYFDANLNGCAVRSPLAVSGAEPSNLRTVRHDERDLAFQTITGDDDLDPFNPPPSTAVVRTVNVDGNRNVTETIDTVRDTVHPLAPTTGFPGSAAGDVWLHAFDGFDRGVTTTDPECRV